MNKITVKFANALIFVTSAIPAYANLSYASPQPQPGLYATHSRACGAVVSETLQQNKYLLEATDNPLFSVACGDAGRITHLTCMDTLCYWNDPNTKTMVEVLSEEKFVVRKINRDGTLGEIVRLYHLYRSECEINDCKNK